MANVQILTSVTDTFLREWQNLWDRSPYANMVNSTGWFTAAVQALGEKDFRILTVYSDGPRQLLAVVPLVKKRVYGITVYTAPALEFADGPQLLMDYRDNNLTQLVIAEIAKLGTVYLANLPAEIISAEFRQAKTAAVFSGAMDPFILLTNAGYGDLPLKKRNNLLHRVKNAREKITIDPVCADPEQALEKAFAIDIASVKHAKGKGVFFREEAKDFYRLLARQCPSNLAVTLISFADKPVSYIIGFCYGGVSHHSQKAYLKGYEYYSLGRLLIINLIDYYRQAGATQVDLGIGYDRFKKDFTPNFRQLSNVIMTKNNLLRWYIPAIYSLHNKTYHYLTENTNFYALYKEIKLFLKAIFKPIIAVETMVKRTI